ncbi:unnamed protein product [Paramecium sonneborni]|uniref:Sec16 Sec23-binding domain-containing protein n=1 Tax=Paramecium sonneborni TaxID=65129 RepID=A0A8S1MZZ9_9CILI|nr:unnamed protein product [Paramecium sonneborni]
MLLKTTQGNMSVWSNLKSQSNLLVSAVNDQLGAQLQFNSFNLGQKNTSTSIIGTISCKDAVTCLAWENFAQETYPMGLVAAGTSEGYVALYDANSAINQEEESCVSIIDQLYEGPVNAIEFNEFKPNLIALGGQDVLIADIIKDIQNPQVFGPGNPNLHEDSSITAVSWNKKILHILASASQNGLTGVWDLRNNKPIFSFQDSSAISNKKVSLLWNPEIPTQIAVAYDDERAPELQIWDLRNPQGPSIVFSQIHKSGINSLSWCPNDHSLLLTGGRDGQVVCWNYKTQSVVSQEQLNFEIADLKWSKRVTSVYSISSVDGQTSIRSLPCGKEGYAPKWLKPPVGSVYAFDQMAAFKENNSAIQVYSINQSDPDNIFENFNAFCSIDADQNRIQFEIDKQHNQQYTQYWKLLNSVQKEDKKEYLATLGFSVKEITQQTENYTGKRHSKKDDQNKKKNQAPQRPAIDFATITDQDADSFFNDLTNQSINKQQQTNSSRNQDVEIFQSEQVSKNTNWNVGVEKIIKDNLIVGNYEGAIDCALKCGRSAEALLLAYSQSKEIFEQTMNTFLTTQTDYFLKNVLKHIVLKHPDEIAKNYELNTWKECAAMVLNSDNTGQFHKIMEQLGDRFIAERKDEFNALQCYILAMNGEKCIKILINHNKSLKELSEAIKLLIVIEAYSLQESELFARYFDSLILQFANYAIQHNQYLSAAYSLNFSSPDCQRALELLDLLYRGNHKERNIIQKIMDKPTFPFKYEQIKMGIVKQLSAQPVHAPNQPVSRPTRPAVNQHQDDHNVRQQIQQNQNQNTNSAAINNPFGPNVAKTADEQVPPPSKRPVQKPNPPVKPAPPPNQTKKQEAQNLQGPPFPNEPFRQEQQQPLVQPPPPPKHHMAPPPPPPQQQQFQSNQQQQFQPPLPQQPFQQQQHQPQITQQQQWQQEQQQQQQQQQQNQQQLFNQRTQQNPVLDNKQQIQQSKAVPPPPAPQRRGPPPPPKK